MKQTATKTAVAKRVKRFLGIFEFSLRLSSVCNIRLGCILDGRELDFQAKESPVSKCVAKSPGGARNQGVAAAGHEVQRGNASRCHQFLMGCCPTTPLQFPEDRKGQGLTIKFQSVHQQPSPRHPACKRYAANTNPAQREVYNERRSQKSGYAFAPGRVGKTS